MRPWADNKQLTVVNMLGGPGCGKSLAASGLFLDMKRKGLPVELLHETAKGLTYDNWSDIMTEQDYIMSQQHLQMRRLVGSGVKYAILDSSLLLGIHYAPADYPDSFRAFVLDVFNSYTNVNIVIERNPNFAYQQLGRPQTLNQAVEIDSWVKDFMVREGIPFSMVLSDEHVVSNISNILDV